MSSPDVVCLQEVSRNCKLKDGTQPDQLNQLSNIFKGYELFFGPAYDVLRPDESKREQFGNIILSKLPVLSSFNHILPQPTNSSYRHMPRQVTEVTVKTQQFTVCIMTTHLEYGSQTQRFAQAKRILDIKDDIDQLSLNPATVQDYIDFGLMGIAMSRYSGCWIGMKCITDTVESAASVDIGLKRFKPVLPDISDEEGDLHLQWGYMPAMSESRLYKQRLPAAQACARANSIDRVIFQGQKKLAIVTSGKAYLDVRQSLDELGLSEKLCSKIGISL